MYAIIDADTVVNVVVWNGDTQSWQPPRGTIAVALPENSPVAIGYSYDGSKFTAPPYEWVIDETVPGPAEL